MAWVLSHSDRPVPIINAGSGRDQHPTQALLDIYTLQRSFEGRGGIDGKTIVFVGDLLRGRTVRSLSSVLTNYRDVRQIFAAPDAFQVADDITATLDARGVTYEKTASFKQVVPVADAIYMTRVQDEWDAVKGESSGVDVSSYSFTGAHLDVLKPDAIVMHPLPRRGEISTEVDGDPRAMYWRQMRNGMWIRTALIAQIFERDGEIRDYGKTG
jgi:aspartate carbamoyltransferase catalytic subunit